MMTTFLANTISFAPKRSIRLPTRTPGWCASEKNKHVQCCQLNWKNQEKTITVQANASANGVADSIRNGGLVLGTSLMETTGDGIGIVKFLHGKVFFITGATGFLAKVLVEKILRSEPDVGKIYLMIKAKNKETAVRRLKAEIIDAEIFKFLKQKYGDMYENFMLSKLIPVRGNISESDIGLDEHVANVIAREVDVFVNSAATTAFNGRYDDSININARGPLHLINFAKKCRKLQLFLQVSTAYVNGQRTGTIAEKLFSMGESIAQENSNSETLSGSLPSLDVEQEIQLALNSKQTFGENSLDHHMRKLGLKRAQEYGWQDTYVFTKAMGEMMIDHTRGEVPVVIIRPSIIESTHKDPFPGWIEGIRMMDPLILHYGKGLLTAVLADPNCVLDIIPADMVVNAILAAMAKHGRCKNADVNVYQIGSSQVNPLTLQDLAGIIFEHFKYSPCMDSMGQPIYLPTVKFYSLMEEFSTHLLKDMTQQVEKFMMDPSNSRMQKKLGNFTKKLLDQLSNLATMYEPYCFYQGRFDCSRTQKLMESMSEDEKMNFGFDVKSIDWKDYIGNVHIPGLRKHVMKEKRHSHSAQAQTSGFAATATSSK